jgi:hypothetical protein
MGVHGPETDAVELEIRIPCRKLNTLCPNVILASHNLKTGFILNNAYKFSSCLTGNTLRLLCENLQERNIWLLREP